MRAIQIASIISVVLSGLVALTLTLFQNLRKKLYMQIIALISLSDLIGNIAYTTTFRPENGNWWCSAQGFFNLYFYPASWMWTTVLMYFLYSLAVSGRMAIREATLHLFCWGLPLLVSLLYLTTNTYGRSSSTESYEVCIISGNPLSSEIWHLTTYYGLWVICIGYMIGMYWRIRYLKSADLIEYIPPFNFAMEALQLYPLAMVLCWFPHFLATLFAYFGKFDGFGKFYFASDIIKISHGTITALIFFYKSKEARNRWKICLAMYACCYNPLVAGSSKEVEAFQDIPLDNEATARETRFDSMSSTDNPITSKKSDLSKRSDNSFVFRADSVDV